jgi:hypothetical protein
MKKPVMLLCALTSLLAAGCALDFQGPCHRATVLRKEATTTYGQKRADILREMIAAQNECDKKNQKAWEKQQKGQ